MPLTIADLTTNLATSATYDVTGDGVFDDLMETINAHMAAQFNLGRITGTDYATVYLTAIEAAIEHSIQYTLGQAKTNAEVSLLFQKEITEFAQTEVATKIVPATGSILDNQATLTAEQAKGFKWNADQKYLKTLLDAWSINISTAGVAATGIDAINETGTDNMNTQISNAEPQA